MNHRGHREELGLLKETFHQMYKRMAGYGGKINFFSASSVVGF